MPVSARVNIRIDVDQPPVMVRAAPLTAVGFAQFGDVVENPRPDLHPSAFAAAVAQQQQHLGIIPHAPIVANQGSAIKYQHPTRPLNFYPQAPSQVPGNAVVNMFTCAARVLEPGEMEIAVEAGSAQEGSGVEIRGSVESEGSNGEGKESEAEADADKDERRSSTKRASTEARAVGATSAGVGSGCRRVPCGVFPVHILERHPFTTQTFVPMSRDGVDTRYLVIVAPSLQPDTTDAGLPVPAPLPHAAGGPQLPGRGLPDLSRLRAFVATGSQAVTYGAGTWHAPMVALGAEGTVVDFFVVQYANGVAIEDCQEAVLQLPLPSAQGGGGGGPGLQQVGIFVQIPESLAARSRDTRGASKL